MADNTNVAAAMNADDLELDRKDVLQGVDPINMTADLAAQTPSVDRSSDSAGPAAVEHAVSGAGEAVSAIVEVASGVVNAISGLLDGV
jgi:hypothetical protein